MPTSHSPDHSTADVAIVGAGLAGLTAALLLRQRGLSVTLIDRASAIGGRARSTHIDGFALDHGPRALYRDGLGEQILSRVGVPVSGEAHTSGWVFDGDAMRRLPFTPVALLTSPLLPGRARWHALRFFAGLGGLDPAALAGRSVEEWLAPLAPPARRLLQMMIRLTTYSNAPALLDAGVAAAQLQAGSRGVRYLDGGWQSLVDTLRARAEGAGVRRVTGRAIGRTPEGVQLDGGRIVPGRAVLVAAGPTVAEAVHQLEFGPGSAARASCLVVALDRLPRPDRVFALGLAEPWYASVPSVKARLAPAGGAVVQILRALGPDEAPAEAAAAEAVLERLQPGWRSAVVHRRWLPRMTVQHRIPLARDGGLAGRVPIEPAPGCFVCGDWVGARGLLADAALASAEDAAEAIARALGAAPAEATGRAA